MGTFGGAQPIVTDGLIFAVDAANYQSYPGSGTTWKDLSGNGNDGTLVNGPTFDSGNGGSLVFDGSNDHVTLGYKENLVGNNITHEAWVNASYMSNWHGIISNMDSWGYGFSLQMGPTQNIAAMVSGYYLKTSWSPLINTWYHIVATHRDSDNLNVLYVNGVQESTLTRSILYETNPITTIGVFYTQNSLRFNGKMGTIKIYNRALTPQEISQNYNALKSRFGL